MSTGGACGTECHFLLATKEDMYKSKVLFARLKPWHVGYGEKR